jgi:hypothetical protein
MALPLFVRKFMAPVEVKLVLSALAEEKQRINDSPEWRQNPWIGAGAETVTSKLVEYLLRWAKPVKEEIHEGVPPRIIVLYQMMNVARGDLASGRFHIYRGKLSMRGDGLRAINSYCLNELTKLGKFTEEERRAAEKATLANIREVG